MRIIAGYLGGRIFDSTAKSTHPMSEKMRGAIFNSLGDIEGLDVLDVFAGSGAVSFEAISRGARSATAIELNKYAQADIENNIYKLGVTKKIKLIRANYLSWLEANAGTYDVIVADPPYDKIDLVKLTSLEDKLSATGVLVLSLPPNSALPTFSKPTMLTQKNYGDSKLVFYKNNL